jgi:transcription elongation factor Elf1|tara:strand:- start:37 stop:228 length:192 start_codon:yes stop_codon:yes gene_type:complete
MELLERDIYCPYCGESQTVLIDTSEEEQTYIEDCQVCCRPIDFIVSVDNQGDVVVEIRHENEG